MKLQVFLRSFGWPLCLVLFLVISYLMGMSPFNAWMHGALAACLILSRLLVDDRYVNTFSIREGRVFITYYNQFLKLKSVECAVSELSGVKLSRRLSISALRSPILDFKADSDWFYFHIIGRRRYEKIQEELATVFEQEEAASREP